MKPTALQTTAFLFLALALGSCVSIKSVVDPNFKRNISHVYVQIHTSETAAGFSSQLQKELVKGFDSHGIGCQVHDYNTLSLESATDVKHEIEQYNPDVILRISQTEQKYYNGAPSGGDYELTMFEPSSDKPVWKAVLSVDTGGWGMGGSTSIAEKILGKLEEDKLIGPPMQKKD